MKKLGRVVSAALRDYFADRCPQQAAGIAYRALFSMAPLAIVLVAVFGLILQDDSLRATVVDMVVDALPVSAARHQDVEDAITAIATPASALGLLALFVFLWAATGMMAAIRQGLECAMSVTESRPMLRAKLVDLALVAGAALLVLVSAAVTLLGVFLDKASDDVADATGIGIDMLATVGLRGASFVLSTVVVAAAVPIRAGAWPARARRSRRSRRHGVAPAGDLARLGLDLREDDRAQRDLRLAHGSARLSLLLLSLRIGPAAGCRGGRSAGAGRLPKQEKEGRSWRSSNEWASDCSSSRRPSYAARIPGRVAPVPGARARRVRAGPARGASPDAHRRASGLGQDAARDGDRSPARAAGARARAELGDPGSVAARRSGVRRRAGGVAAADAGAPIACLTYQALARLDDPGGRARRARGAALGKRAGDVDGADARRGRARGRSVERRGRGSARSASSRASPRRSSARSRAASTATLRLRDLLGPGARERLDVLRRERRRHGRARRVPPPRLALGLRRARRAGGARRASTSSG